MRFLNFILFLIIFTFINACNQKANENEHRNEKSVAPNRELSNDFKKYWFSGEAEITTYKLDQFRNHEQREGTVSLIYVTEDFNTEEQVKTDKKTNNSEPILKLNAVKKFTTGIYPYSIMESTFYPLIKEEHALKVTASSQEWCGQMYLQLNNNQNFKLIAHSYFEDLADKALNLKKIWLENEIWTQLRIAPNKLPTGDIEILPSFEYLLLDHKTIQPYTALAEFYQKEELSVYKISYPELDRTLKIYYHNEFPYHIEKWEETVIINGKEYMTSAIKMKTIKSDYWNKNSNKDLSLRDTLNLD